MICDHQPEETKYCRIIKNGGACGPEEILLTNKLRIFDIKKKTVPFSNGTGQGTFLAVSPVMFKGLIHPFPNCSHKHILSLTEFGTSTCAALHHLFYSHFNPAPTWLARPKVLWQKISGHSNPGLSWEPPVERLPTFPWIHPSYYTLPYPPQLWNHY